MYYDALSETVKRYDRVFTLFFTIREKMIENVKKVFFVNSSCLVENCENNIIVSGDSSVLFEAHGP